MPFRERAKNLFKTKSRSDSTAKSDTTADTDRDRYPSNVYKPGEIMPRPKYRMPPKKEHKEKLESFNFANAWRKKSFQSSYSPMGTRAPSRRTSWYSMGRRSMNRSSRNNSVTSGETEKSGGGVAGARPLNPPAMATQAEQEGDDDVANVGISRVQSRDKATPPPLQQPRPAEDRRPSVLHPVSSTAHDHQPFTEQELSLALQRSPHPVEVQAQS